MIELNEAEKAIATLMLEINRLNDELNLVKKELALQRLSDISQEIEDKESAIYATGYWNGIAKVKPRELTDKEIGEFKGQWYRGDFNSFYDFVQAILKKANEK